MLLQKPLGREAEVAVVALEPVGVADQVVGEALLAGEELVALVAGEHLHLLHTLLVVVAGGLVVTVLVYKLVLQTATVVRMASFQVHLQTLEISKTLSTALMLTRNG